MRATAKLEDDGSLVATVFRSGDHWWCITVADPSEHNLESAARLLSRQSKLPKTDIMLAMMLAIEGATA